MMVSGEKDETEVGKLKEQSQEPSVPPETPDTIDTVPPDSTKVTDTDSVPDPSNETLAKNAECPSSVIDKTDQDQGHPQLSETNVVSPSESKQSESDNPVLDFEDYSPSSDALLLNRESDKPELNTNEILKPNEILTVGDSLKSSDADEVEVVEPPKSTPPRLLKAVINFVPQILPDHVVKHFKNDETSRKRKLSKGSESSVPNKRFGQPNDLDHSDSVPVHVVEHFKIFKNDESSRKRKLSKNSGSSVPNKRYGQPNDLDHSDSVPAIDANMMVNKSTELDMSDKFYEMKRVLLQVTRESSGAVNLKRFKQFSNIFLKSWRFSKQFPGSTNARGKQVIHNMLEKIVKDLRGNGLIVIRGPEDNLDVIKMLTEEVKGDNSRVFSQTPPTLTVLVTENLFDKYYIDGSKRFLSSESGLKRPQSKSVSLGSASEQWFRLKKELGMDSHGEVASILMHCYKAWTSVACSKCRRHMEVGMEQKTGRTLMNSESSVCIVSCECGKYTSGGFMIECDSCHKWQHGVCVGITKDNIPVHHSCRRCCNIRGSVVLSPLRNERDGNMSDNSVVSIDNTELYSTDGSGPEVIELD